MNAESHHAFAHAVFGDAFELGLHAVMVGIPPVKDKGTLRILRCDSVRTTVDAVRTFKADHLNVYYPTVVLRAGRELPAGSRGGEAHADALLGFHVDLDLKGPAHTAATIPDVETAMRILEAFEIKPSVVIKTGHGVQAVWLFKEPLIFANDDERARAKLLVRRFICTIAAVARQLGGHTVDTTGDLARVLRFPGTTNMKVVDGKALVPEQTRVINPEGSLDTLVRYNPDDIEPHLVHVRDDSGDVNLDLVGAFTLNEHARAPLAAVKLSLQCREFALFWENDANAPISDKSTSRYRFEMIGRLVDAGATDQDIADAVCAWYARHHPDYDKHLHRRGLLAFEIAKQRSRFARRGAMPVPPPSPVPALEGPQGVQLMVTSVNKTPSRWNFTFEVHVSGQDTGIEIAGTSKLASHKQMIQGLLEAVESAPGHRSLSDEDRNELTLWMKRQLTTKGLKDLHTAFERHEALARLTPGAVAPRVIDIVIPHLRESLGLAFVDPDGSLWSERLGRSLRRHEFLALTDQRLLKAIASAADYAAPTAGNPTRPIRQLEKELGVAWGTLLNELPDELHARDLGPQSKAARRFRSQLAALLLAPATWIRHHGSGAKDERSERASLVTRAKALADRGGPRIDEWRRIGEDTDAWYRVDIDANGELRLWLAIRADFCRGFDKQQPVPSVHSQSDLSLLMARYGLLDEGSVTDRIRLDTQRLRLCVLSRGFCDALLDGRSLEGAEIDAPDSVSVQASGPAPQLRTPAATVAGEARR